MSTKFIPKRVYYYDDYVYKIDIIPSKLNINKENLIDVFVIDKSSDYRDTMAYYSRPQYYYKALADNKNKCVYICHYNSQLGEHYRIIYREDLIYVGC